MNSWNPGQDIFSGHHTFVMGASQQGKTHFMRKRVTAVKRPVLFFNPQEEELPGFVKASPENDLKVIMDTLKKGHKVNFVPSLDNKRAAVELAILVDSLFRSGWTKERNMILVIDECHLAEEHKEGLRVLKLVSTRGIRYGIHAVFGTQRAANVDLNTFTMSDLLVLFRTNRELQYLRGKGIDVNTYDKMIKDGGQYSYAVNNGLEMMGPFKE